MRSNGRSAAYLRAGCCRRCRTLGTRSVPPSSCWWRVCRMWALLRLRLPSGPLLLLLAGDRSKRIDQAHLRLKLVEQERARLQSAVRRLGDAFAAKLELDGLLEILLQGSVEALDAGAGRLELAYGNPPLELVCGRDGWLDVLGRDAPRADTSTGPLQVGQAGAWTLSVPMRVAPSSREITGIVSLSRAGR